MDAIARFSFAITAAITIVGWFIVARQTERREFRKEVRDRIAELTEAATAVEAAAMLYWIQCPAKEASTAALSLTSAVARLSRRALVLKQAGLEFDQPVLLSEIRKAATGGDFGSKGRRRKADDNQKMVDTAGCLEDLLVAVDTAFYTEFRPVRPSAWWRFAFLAAILLLLWHN